MPYTYDRLIHPQNIQSESDYNMKNLVMKQYDRANHLLSIEKARTTGSNENYRALGFGAKSAVEGIEAMISPQIREDCDYYRKTKVLRQALTYLETNHQVNSRSYHYTRLLNIWLGLLAKELSHLGYFPSKPYDDDDENYD